MNVWHQSNRPRQSRSPSPDLPSNITHTINNDTYETVPTLPLQHYRDAPSQFESMTPLPHGAAAQQSSEHRTTQPTQLLNISSPDMPTSPPTSTVQVAASSPSKAPPRRQNSILASAMAPAGTAFRKPYIPSQPQTRPTAITIDSDDEGPRYLGGNSSDSDREILRRNDIKSSIFRKPQERQAEKVPESPQTQQTNDRFKQITAGARYDPTAGAISGNNSTANNGLHHLGNPVFRPLGLTAGIKRSSDVAANAYGSISKKPRQNVPSRAQPVSLDNSEDEEPMTLDDFRDPGTRNKVRHLHSVFPSNSVRSCYEALVAKRFNFSDAQDHILLMSEERDKARTHVDLTGSEDELMRTPLQRALPARVEVKQQAKKPVQSIRDKYTSTQASRKPSATKPLDIFEEPKPGRKLVRGRKHASSPAPISPKPRGVQTIDSDDSMDEDSGIHSGAEDGSFDGRLLSFFNTCSAADLSDTAGIARDLAEHIVSKRPFRNLRAIQSIQNPNLKPTKTKKQPAPIGDKVVDKCVEMLQSYEAVDYLVKKCENIAKPLAKEMEGWGVKAHGSTGGELELATLKGSPRPSHDSGIGTPVSDAEEDKINSTKKPSSNYIGQPSIMAEGIQMKDYQVVGLNWLALLFKKRLSCILADDMGLGKTCQVIAFFAWLLENGESGPHLVVVPAATLENWLQELRRFCPKLRVEPYYGTLAERHEMRAMIDDEREQVNVVVTTYTIAKGKEDAPWLKHYGFCCTVYDEGHVLKNAESQVAQKLVRIQSKFRLLLTGTPLQNNLKELMSLLGFLMPQMFQEKTAELQAIFTHHVKALEENHEALLSAQRIARARTMLTPFILRRKKYQVLRELPKKERRVEYCDMTPEQESIYHEHLAKALDVRARREAGENVSSESTNILMRLRQAAIHPFLFRRQYPDKILPKIARACLKEEKWALSNPDLILTELREYSDMELHKLCDENGSIQKFALNHNEWLASGKVRKMLELVRRYMAEGARILIFSTFVMVLDILELVFEREAVAYFRLDGNTKVAERQDLIDEFCAEDNDTPIFMLSTKAGGAGINLAKANKVIVFDSGFNPQDDVQAENRAHRIGQTKEVEVVRLVTRNTVEEQIYAMGLTKLRLEEEVAGDGTTEVDAVRDAGIETKKEEEGRKVVEELFWRKITGGSGDGTATPKTEEQVTEAEVCLKKVEEEASSPVKNAPGVMKEVSSRGAIAEDVTPTEDDDVTITGASIVRSQQDRKPSVDLPSRPRRAAASKPLKTDGDVSDDDD